MRYRISVGSLLLLIDTARLLAGNRNVAVEIQGDLGDAGADVRSSVIDLRKGAGAVLRFVGPAERNGISRCMRDVDAVVVPSVGLTGGPDPIDAALRNRRPVICPGAGEFAERVRDGIDGYHFPPGDAASLAQLLARLAALPHRLHDLNRTLRSPPAPAEAAAQYAALYQRVCLAAR